MNEHGGNRPGWTYLGVRASLLTYMAGDHRLGGRALAGEPPGRRLVRLTEADTHHLIVVRKGDTVELRLPEAPAGGYLWRWRLPEGLRMMVDEHLQAGQRRLAFDVHAPGRHELRVELARPWESEPRQALTFTLDAQ